MIVQRCKGTVYLNIRLSRLSSCVAILFKKGFPIRSKTFVFVKNTS